MQFLQKSVCKRKVITHSYFYSYTIQHVFKLKVWVPILKNMATVAKQLAAKLAIFILRNNSFTIANHLDHLHNDVNGGVFYLTAYFRINLLRAI